MCIKYLNLWNRMVANGGGGCITLYSGTGHARKKTPFSKKTTNPRIKGVFLDDVI